MYNLLHQKFANGCVTVIMFYPEPLSSSHPQALWLTYSLISFRVDSLPLARQFTMEIRLPSGVLRSMSHAYMGLHSSCQPCSMTTFQKGSLAPKWINQYQSFQRRGRNQPHAPQLQTQHAYRTKFTWTSPGFTIISGENGHINTKCEALFSPWESEAE